MTKRIEEAFNYVHAEEQLKDNTKDFLAEKIAKRQPRRRPAYLKYVITAACCLLAILGLSGFAMYQTPVAAISIDVNPSLELAVNRFDRVIEVNCYNDDAQQIVSELDLQNMSYQNAVTEILDCMKAANYINDNSLVNIAVAAKDSSKSEQIQQNINSCTGNRYGELRCHSYNAEDIDAAHQCGLSLGKYQALLQLQKIDPDITAEDIHDLSMRQIQDLLDSYGLENNSGSGSGYGNGTGTGYGNGSDSNSTHDNGHHHQQNR